MFVREKKKEEGAHPKGVRVMANVRRIRFALARLFMYNTDTDENKWKVVQTSSAKRLSKPVANASGKQRLFDDRAVCHGR